MIPADSDFSQHLYWLMRSLSKIAAQSQILLRLMFFANSSQLGLKLESADAQISKSFETKS